MTCTYDCQRPTPAQAHCAADGCHRTFGGVSGFDRHRRDGRCLDPAPLGYTEIRGIWRQPLDDDARSRLWPAPQAAEQGLPVPASTPSRSGVANA